MKKLFFCGLFLSVFFYSTAQSGNPDNFQKMVDFLPPPPNAAAIIKHSALSINKNNGSPSFNIPIFTVKGTKLSANISIGYSSTGLKVDEIASRVGMGWALNAGGVVTRTVRGVVDEWNNRVVPYSDPIQGNCGNFDFMNNVANSLSCNGSGCNGSDAEPDLFNFNMNGISGSFVYDGNGQPVLIPAEKYKIEKDLNGTAWNFKITNTDGVMYYFGGTGAVEKTKRLSNCGKNFDAYIANSWYLVKIEHPNGETINLSYTALNYDYDNGVNETQYWAYWMIDYNTTASFNTINCPSGTCPPAPATTVCVNTTSTQGVLLNTITSGNDIVSFIYQSRMDCSDQLVSQIRHYSNTEHIETVNFFYQQQLANAAFANQTNGNYNKYTPYLTDLQRVSSDYVFTNTHRFVYNDPAGRPPRLSFSQDHWGYFNGRVNTTFIPKPDDLVLQGRFPNATAYREPDPAFASKGMLIKIVYPTGGIDYIDYESNEVNDVITGPATYQTLHEYNCNVTGTGFTTENSKSTTFTIDKAQNVELVITCSTSNQGAYDSLHMKGSVEVTSATSSILYEYFLAGNPGIQYTRYLNPTWMLQPGTYTLTYKAKGAAQTTTVKLRYYPATIAPNNINKIVGGVRVKRVMTGNPTEKPMIKRYYYANMGTLNESSMNTIQWPKYNKNYRNTMSCYIIEDVTQQHLPLQSYCDLTAMYSGSLLNLFNYGSGLISYASVIESTGENFEGGAVQTKFYVNSDANGQVIWGNDILGAPKSNFSSIYNGKVYEEIVYKKPSAGALFPIKKTLYNYLIDQRQQNLLYGYNVNKKYNIVLATPGQNCPPTTTLLEDVVNSFDVVKYSIMSYWTHPETVTETLYDENGANPVTTVTNSFFDNEQHLQLTRSEMVNSKNETLKTTNTYPPDFPGISVYASMTAKNIITPVVTSKSDNGSSEVSFNKINYGDVGNNNFVPISVEKSVKGNLPLETEGTIDAYDANGNILQFTGKTGIVTAIIWGYNYKYPVAQVVGATYANAISQLTGGTVTAIQSMDGATLRTELHRIRTGIVTASVTSYTYKVMTGLTSITDPNNKTNTYDYDSFNRLMTIKDQDGNVVKKNEYHYAGSNAGSTLLVFFNAARTKNYQCMTCVPGYIDNTTYAYNIPPGKYYSLVSQDAADVQAAADNDGQEYVNRNAKCVNSVTATCTGSGYKVVNCVCELGDKVCEYSTPDGNGGWYAHFHFLWSDGSTSPSFTELVSSCSGVDKKFINCVCETGEKVCEDVQDNGGGSYTLTYHYQWSDFSISSTIVETITCSGEDKKMIGCECKTGIKIYTESVLCGDKNPMEGCCTGKWRCTYHYLWSDNTRSQDYYECADASCMEMPIEL